jgi:ribonuclease HII
VLVGGVDEVGRGAWAGPLVVALAVSDCRNDPLSDLLRRPSRDRKDDEKLREGQFLDSKALPPKRRQEIAALLPDLVLTYGIGTVSTEEIDLLGLSEALTLGAQRAFSSANVVPESVVLDGSVDYLSKRVGIEVATYPRGDTRFALVAAASIVAKVARDAAMVALAQEVPYYGFEDNKGYPTSTHLRGLAAVGPSIHHRCSWSFGPKLLYQNPYIAAERVGTRAVTSRSADMV